MAVPKSRGWDELPGPPLLLPGYYILVDHDTPVPTDNLPEVSISTNEMGVCVQYILCPSRVAAEGVVALG